MQVEWEERVANHLRRLREQDKTIEELRKANSELDLQARITLSIESLTSLTLK